MDICRKGFQKKLQNQFALFQGTPFFDKPACYGRNGNLVFKWLQLEGRVDDYVLEIKTKGENFKCVYQGKDCAYTLNDLPYGEAVTARLKAKNKAGIGNASEEVDFLMPKGKNIN